MYGLVNKGLQEFLVKRHGEYFWQELKQEAGVDNEVFSLMHSYDDTITYSLVMATCKKLSLNPEEFLMDFGKFWIPFSKSKGYEHYYQLGGDTMFDFLSYLDQMHANIKTSFPGMEPPSFRCERVDDDSFYLFYYSSREGLFPFVKGLAYGLAEHFSNTIELKEVELDTDKYKKLLITVTS